MYNIPQNTPVMISTQLNVDGLSNTVSSKFIPKTAVTTANTVVTKVAAVRSNSNWIS